MKYCKAMAPFLAFLLLLPMFTVPVSAEDTPDFTVSASPAGVNVGDEVEVTVSLTGYTEEFAQTDAIEGVQVDITGVDADILNVSSHSSLIEDTNGILSNKTSYQPKKSLVRLLYMKMDGTLAAPCTDVMKVVFRVNSGLTASGSITLPVTVKIQTESQKITLNRELVITYTAASTNVTSIDIAWGAMDFTYSDGLWNTASHSYGEGGWIDSGTGYVTLKNTGSAATTATLSYETEREDISGTFTDGTDSVTDVTIAARAEKTVYLKLDGKPAEALDKAVIGTITVRIGGE